MPILNLFKVEKPQISCRTFPVLWMRLKDTSSLAADVSHRTWGHVQLCFWQRTLDVLSRKLGHFRPNCVGAEATKTLSSTITTKTKGLSQDLGTCPDRTGLRRCTGTSHAKFVATQASCVCRRPKYMFNFVCFRWKVGSSYCKVRPVCVNMSDFVFSTQSGRLQKCPSLFVLTRARCFRWEFPQSQVKIVATEAGGDPWTCPALFLTTTTGHLS